MDKSQIELATGLTARYIDPTPKYETGIEFDAVSCGHQFRYQLGRPFTKRVTGKDNHGRPVSFMADFFECVAVASSWDRLMHVYLSSRSVLSGDRR